MVLKDSWLQLRQKRQQEAAQRRQQVSTLLRKTQEHRHEKASLLRSDLSLFREMLAADVASQRQMFQVYHQTRQQETQAFLSEIRDRRYEKAQETAQHLSNFVDRLQQQTSEFLAVTTAERGLMSQQLACDLKTFQTTLVKTVEILRRRLQADMQAMQVETHALLENAHHRRVQMRIQQMEDLSTFVTQLQAEVQQYLADAAIARQERAIELADLLEQSEAKRKKEVQALFERFAEFRSRLHQFVWGETATCVEQDSEATALLVQVSLPGVEPPAQKSVSIAKAASPKGFVPTKQSSLAGKSVKPEPLEESADRANEEKVFQYIDQVQEARLTEIESALELSRYQAIESLRSLIQKGMIVQRNRVYRVSEAFSR